MKKVSVIFLLLILGVGSKCISQNAAQNQGFWFAYNGQYKVSPKWGYHLEVQFRTDENLENSTQNLFRLGVLYHPSKQTQVALGYAHATTYSEKYDDYFGENRIWQHFQHTYKWANQKNHFINRIRLEERFIDKLGEESGNVKVIKTNYDTRLRYLNRNLFHLLKFNDDQDELYTLVQDEIFLNFNHNENNSHFFDQNRFLVGMGINHNNMIRFEVGYMNQYLNLPTGPDMMNHIILFGIFHNLNFYKD